MDLKALQPVLVTVAVGVIGAFTPQITTWVAAHPDTAVSLATLLGAVLHVLPSPAQPKP